MYSGLDVVITGVVCGLIGWFSSWLCYKQLAKMDAQEKQILGK